jgi:hypothetical protein
MKSHERFGSADLLRFALLFGFLFAYGLHAHGAERKRAASAGGQNAALAKLKKQADSRQLESELTETRMRLADLEARRKETIQAARSQVRALKEGVELLKQYEKLLVVRYVDDEGAFAPASEVSGDDLTNLNQMFEKYLRTLPFQGRVSARFARETVHKGISRLEDVVSEHDSPSPSSHAELDVITHQVDEEKSNIERILETADAQGIKLDPKAPLNARTPASGE